VRLLGAIFILLKQGGGRPKKAAEKNEGRESLHVL
jgi:hypothetical protein